MTKNFDPIALTVFASRLNAVCDEMGAQLCRAAFSPNIRDRLDYSCAVFDPAGNLCAQAAHIPVHLGSMAYAMSDVVDLFQWKPGDMAILNDPFKGGTHLPDVTVVAPVFMGNVLCGFVANRAHHADIGASSPGSMPVSAHIGEEGELISPRLLIRQGNWEEEWYRGFLSKLRNPALSEGDFNAQVAANLTGVARLLDLVKSTGGQTAYIASLEEVNGYGERLARAVISTIPDGSYGFSDVMDSDGQGQYDLPIQLMLTIDGEQAVLDFDGTAPQAAGNINSPLSVAAAAAYYVFRCLMPDETPACQGVFTPIQIHAPEGCLINAAYPAAVAAGNVETSTRIVDVVMGALSQAIPDKVPAMSYGTMNNLAMGYQGDQQQAPWDYYETIGGGMGAGPDTHGVSCIQAHMTNTLNTPIEVIEAHYPVLVTSYGVNRGSGGEGVNQGGDGIIREYAFKHDALVTLLTERRRHPPQGSNGGGNAKSGQNRLNGELLADKCEVAVKKGDCLTIKTPGGGGYGESR